MKALKEFQIKCKI